MKKRTIGTLVLLMASAGAALGQQSLQPLQHWAETNPARGSTQPNVASSSAYCSVHID